MHITRRRFVAGSIGAAGMAGIGLGPRVAHAQIDLGNVRLDVVSDGALALPGSFVFDPMPKDELQAVLEAQGISPEVLTPPCNVTLMRSSDRTVLFDVGSGPDFAATAGTLGASLDALGVAPEEVTDVIFTHGHPDHLWGLLDDFGDPLFVGARYMMGRAEWDYWLNPATVDQIGEARVAFAVGAERRLRIIEEDMTLFDDGDEVLPGVLARATSGHTPGHMALEVRDGTESVMILGDCIGNHHVAFARPDWLSGSDQDQELAATTRVALLDQLAHEQTRIIGFHLPQGFGRVEKTADAYRFVPGVD